MFPELTCEQKAYIQRAREGAIEETQTAWGIQTTKRDLAQGIIYWMTRTERLQRVRIQRDFELNASINENIDTLSSEKYRLTDRLKTYGHLKDVEISPELFNLLQRGNWKAENQVASIYRTSGLTVHSEIPLALIENKNFWIRAKDFLQTTDDIPLAVNFSQEILRLVKANMAQVRAQGEIREVIEVVRRQFPNLKVVTYVTERGAHSSSIEDLLRGF